MSRLVLSCLLVLSALFGSAVHARPSLFSIKEPWLDEDGQRVQLSQWQGKPTVVAMEYSACRFICSVYWRRLMQIQQAADRLGLKLQFLILSIDPEHDSPASWRDYRKARDLQRNNWHFLTGSRPMTTRAAALMGVRWWYDEGHLMHDFKVVRLTSDGAIAHELSSYDGALDALLTPP